jgi:hypothetical protein
MSNYSEFAEKLLAIGKFKAKAPDYKAFGFSVANADAIKPLLDLHDEYPFDMMCQHFSGHTAKQL